MLQRIMTKAALIAFACTASIAVNAYAIDRKPIEISPGELATALRTLAAQAGVEFFYQSDLVTGLLTHGVSGMLSPEEAVTKLLEGTALSLQTDSSGAMLIVRLPVGPAATKPPNGEPVAPTAKPQDSSQSTHTMEGMPKRSFWDRFRLAQTNSPGTAEGRGEGSAPSEGERGELEEIVVTAQKKEERLLETPQSVSVLSGADLQRSGALQFRDFASAVPGLSFTTGGAGYTQIVLRGVTTGINDVGPTTTTYVDEVPYGGSTSYTNASLLTLDVGLFDLDRIEVLRGPQGTLYGAGSMGGILKYVTRAPQLGSFAVDVRTGVSSIADGGVSYDGSGVVNLPMGDSAALRIAGFYSHDGGFVDDVQRGRHDVDRSNTAGGRLDLLASPTDALSVRLTGSTQNIERDGTAQSDYILANGEPVQGRLEQRRFGGEPFEQRFHLLSATVNYRFEKATLTSVTSYQEIRPELTLDYSSLFVPFFADGSVVVASAPRTNKVTQELRLAGERNGPLEWLVGAFYTHETSLFHGEFILRDAGGNLLLNALYNLDAPVAYRELAGFGDLTWHLSDRFDVTGGLRYSRSHQRYEQTGSGAFIDPLPPRESSEGVATYLANARFRLSDHSTAYARYATGYRPGGPNVVPNDPATGEPLASPTFEADRLASYELGYKAESSDRKLGLDVAAYYIDWDNIQVATGENGLSITGNAAGGAAIKGAELTLTARPISGLTASGAFAYQHAALSKADVDLGARNGERLPNVPRFTAALNADYALARVPLSPLVGATWRYVSDRNVSFDLGSDPQYRLPKYSLLDLRAGLTLGRVDAQVFVRNVFDERGQLSAITFLGDPARVSLLQPRTVGIALTAHY